MTPPIRSVRVRVTSPPAREQRAQHDLDAQQYHRHHRTSPRSWDRLRPWAEEGELALLGIEAHQRADNCFHHQELVLRITSVQFPALDLSTRLKVF